MTVTVPNHGSPSSKEKVELESYQYSTLQGVLGKNNFSHFGWNYSGQRTAREKNYISFVLRGILVPHEYLGGMPVA